MNQNPKQKIHQFKSTLRQYFNINLDIIFMKISKKWGSKPCRSVSRINFGRNIKKAPWSMKMKNKMRYGNNMIITKQMKRSCKIPSNKVLLIIREIIRKVVFWSLKNDEITHCINLINKFIKYYMTQHQPLKTLAKIYPPQFRVAKDQLHVYSPV